MRRVLLMVFMCLPFLLWAEDFERAQIRNRIKPYGQVSVEEELPSDSQVEKDIAQTKEEDERLSPKAIYTQYCAVCHRSGLASAPIYRNKAQWKSRLAAKSIDELTISAVKGINAMPPKGTCNTCSNDDIRAAIEYMLPQ